MTGDSYLIAAISIIGGTLLLSRRNMQACWPANG
jgi:hypothetical protein